MQETHHSDGPAGVQDSVQKTSHGQHHTPPNVLVVGTETAVFDPSSPVRERILAYTKHFGETHIIVMCRGNFKQEVINNVTIHPTNSSTRFLYGIHAYRLAKGLKGVDVVTAQDPHDSGLPALFIARHLMSALHIQVHADVFSPSFVTHSFINRLRALIARFVLARADGIRVVSQSIKTSIEKRLSSKQPAIVLPIFIDVERFKSAHPGELSTRFSSFKNKILWVGRFEPEKNAMLAIGAFAASAGESDCLIFLGKGSQAAQLEARAQETATRSRIFFEGTHDPAPYYAACDLVLVTSDYEGYGRVTVEALAAGKPVLSTDVGIARESGALLTDKSEFAAALKKWLLSGPRTGELRSYPYRNYDEYVSRYVDNIGGCALK